MTIVRELVTFLGFEVDDKALKKAQEEFKGLTELAKGVVGAVAAVTGALGALAVETADFSDDIGKAAAALGISRRALQELQFAAGTARVETSGLRSSLRDLQKNSAEAAQGNAELAIAFNRLGVSLRGSDGRLKAVDVLLDDVGRGLAKIPDPSRRTALALKIMGGEGAKLLPIFTRGADGLANARREAQALGLVLGDAALDQGEAFAVEMSAAGEELKAFARTIGAEVIPHGRRLIRFLRDAVRGQRGLITRSARGSIKALARSMEIAAELARRFGKPLVALVRSMGGLETVTKLAGLALGAVFLVKLGRVILALNGAVKAGKGLFVTFKLLALAPALAAIKWLAFAALVGLVIDDVLTFARGGESVLGKLLEKFTEPVNPDDTWPVKIMKQTIGMITTAAEQLAIMLGMLKEEKPADLTGTELKKNYPKTTRIRAPRAGELPTSTPAMRRFPGGISGPAVFGLGFPDANPNAGGPAALRLEGPDGSDLAARNLGRAGARGGVTTINAPVNVRVDASGAQDPPAVGRAVGGSVNAAVEDGIARAFERAKLSQDGARR